MINLPSGSGRVTHDVTAVGFMEEWSVDGGADILRHGLDRVVHILQRDHAEVAEGRV